MSITDDLLRADVEIPIPMLAISHKAALIPFRNIVIMFEVIGVGHGEKGAQGSILRI
jgi:hypothetical protein